MNQGSTGMVSLKVDIAKMVGLTSTNHLLNNPSYWGYNGGDPSSQVYAFVGAGAQGAGNPDAQQMQARIVYHVKFLNPIVNTVS